MLRSRSIVDKATTGKKWAVDLSIQFEASVVGSVFSDESASAGDSACVASDEHSMSSIEFNSFDVLIASEVSERTECSQSPAPASPDAEQLVFEQPFMDPH